MHYVYILRCADNSLYIGETNGLAARLVKHTEGSASGFTAARRPVVMVYAEAYCSRATALKRTRQLKRRTHAKKEALINADRARLKAL
jgi:predicted GIY-YIG superfamily endonuclease